MRMCAIGFRSNVHFSNNYKRDDLLTTSCLPNSSIHSLGICRLFPLPLPILPFVSIKGFHERFSFRLYRHCWATECGQVHIGQCVVRAKDRGSFAEAADHAQTSAWDSHD